MTSSLEDELQHIRERKDDQQNDQQQHTIEITEQEIQPEKTIHIHYFPDAILILKEEEPVQVVESTPVLPQKISYLPAYAICCLYIILIVSTLIFQVYCLCNPLTATVTIIPTAHSESMTGTMQLGRVLPPLTISQSQTTPATGTGHQDARAAAGYITFYNGQFQTVTIAAGTILTGASGIQVVIDQDATIVAANPPSFGYITVSAHAMNSGSNGNIPAYDINQACCAAAVLAKNIYPFTGGQNERTYTTVTHNDIHRVSTLLKTTLAQSITGALQGQRQPNEQLHILPCTSTVISDHQPGDEATQVKVTVSETCSAIAYDMQALIIKATQLLTTQRNNTLVGYSLFGNIQVSVTQASVRNTSHTLVFLSFQTQGTWIYGISRQSQQQIKQLVSGKTTQEAQNLLASLPGVSHATIRFSGFGDNTHIPTNSRYIHITSLVV